MSSSTKIVDHGTFDRMLQGSTKTTSTKIRNSKYKRTQKRTSFNLFNFVTTRSEKKIRYRTEKRAIMDQILGIKKKKGKQRETGRKKRPSPLKKSILRYRQKKREIVKFQESLKESCEILENLSLQKKDKSNLHSRKFREYCTNCTNSKLEEASENFIRELYRFQRRSYSLNEIKARAHRRFVLGFREVHNYLRINKLKFVIIATDCEQSEENEGLNEIINSIKLDCFNQQVPVAFVFNRRKLAYILYRKASISCVGIVDYDGARDLFSQVLTELTTAQEAYRKCIEQ